MNYPLPMRPRKADIARAAQMQAMQAYGQSQALGMPGFGFDPFFGSMMAGPQANPYQGAYAGMPSYGQPGAIPSSSSGSQSNYGAAGSAQSAPSLPLHVAAQNLYNALFQGCNFCIDFDRDFHDETFGIKHYVSQELMDAIWKQRLEFQGEHPSASVPGVHGRGRHAPTTFSGFSGMKSILHKALMDMSATLLAGGHNTGRPGYPGYERQPEGGARESKTNPEDLKRALEKLKLYCKGIVEMLDAVKTDRTRMKALIEEIESTKELLSKNRHLWPEPRRPAVGRDDADASDCFD
ncbi:hypothetical protein M8818_004440 [Zalaria obscura]|uniref:Uncharacterized protein n=1 Tax=Zalaria obscura TaxID=2024903 RepID=A0ACC3SE89_9PEZI